MVGHGKRVGEAAEFQEPGEPEARSAMQGQLQRFQLHRGQLQPVQLPGLDAPSIGKTSVLQPWREYPWILPPAGKLLPPAGKPQY